MTGLRPLFPATELNTASVPPPRASRRLRACSQNTTVLVKSTSSRRRARSASCSSSSCRAKSPAVTTSASRPPRRISAASSAAAKPPGFSRSQGAAPTDPLPARASRSRALRSRSATSRPRRKTSSPRAAIRRESDRPMPRVAPRKATFILRPARSRAISQEAHGLSAAQPALGVPLAPDARPRGQPWLHGPEVLRAGELVLRQVDAASLGDDQLVEGVDERLRLVVDRDVERDRDARPGEAQQADPLRAAVLDHAQHRGAPAPREQLQEAASRSSARRLGQHALVLREAARAVHAVPVADGVERIEERLGMHDRARNAG